MTAPPSIAVVVATHNRAANLPRLLRAIEAQVDVDTEVVFVDDCSTDDTGGVLAELAATAAIPVRVLRTPANAGPAAARNLGWRAATAPLVAFTDDDCEPDAKWLAVLSRALGHADVVQGATLVDPEVAEGRGPFARVQIVERFDWLFATCNMGYRRQVLERVGGFDERFRRPFGEDVDLAWRAIEAGATTAWEPDAVVIHDVETTGSKLRDWVVWVRDTRRREYAALMVRRHPGLREHLHRRWFYKPNHPPTWLALAGVAIALSGPSRGGRLATAAGLAVPWVWHRTVRNPVPARRRWLPAVLPMTFVGDVAEAAVMVRGSIKHRTLLL